MSNSKSIHDTSIAPVTDLSEYRRENNQLSNKYSSFLSPYEDQSILLEGYFYFGAIDKQQGWIIHLSVVKSQIISLFDLLIPYLLKRNMAFKIPATMEIANSILDGKLGYTILGKIITIYPEDETIAVQIIRDIIPSTEMFSGPPIPTDRQLHNIIYTRYGSFNQILQPIGGVPSKYIYDENGALIPDPYSVPFKCPHYLNWPFIEFANPQPLPEPRLLNFTYYPVRTLKSDAKGKVIKAVYFRKFYHIQSCLIKEGKANMLSDPYNRDIRDRLKWQYQIQTSLYPKISMPKAIDYFLHKNNDYFVMEYIKGEPLASWLEKNNKEQPWISLSISIKLRILNKLLEILTVIEALHDSGYVHRDLNHFNIVIKKNGKIVLIDLELAWSLQSGEPYPPFQLGTHGFMSPQQIAVLKPTVKEDIYALGAIMIKLFTNLSPNKLTFNSSEDIHEALVFFTGEINMASLIIQCIQDDPDLRPAIANIKAAIANNLNSLQKTNSNSDKTRAIKRFDYTQALYSTISAAINGLSHHNLLNDRHLWLSRIKSDERYIINKSDEMRPLAGWHTGVAGPLWVLARAKKIGFNISVCNEQILSSLEYLINYLQENLETVPSGLYHGSAGIAMALSECIHSELVPLDFENKLLLSKCFNTVGSIGGISTGISGQGVALLSCANLLPQDQFSKTLDSYVNILCDSQRSNGSWQLDNGKKNIPASMGLSEGVLGIIWFLLAAANYTQNDDIKKSVHKALYWLKRKTKYATHNFTLTFIKAYHVFQDYEFKKIVEKRLSANLPKRVTDDLSLKTGLAAIGETYLEASLIFSDSKWKQSADWIAEALIYTMQKGSNGRGVWQIDYDGIVTADLFDGISGLLHFLLRMYEPIELSQPIWPLSM